MRASLIFKITLCALAISLSCGLGNQQQVCQRICALFLTPDSPVTSHGNQTTQGRPGKRGAQGFKGDKGDIGPKGTVDYERVDDIIEAKISAATDSMKTRIVKMSEMMDQMNRTISMLVKRNSEVCAALFYNGKCFQAILHDEQDVTISDATNMCESNGWELANIYSENHYSLVIEYLRRKSRDIFIWLGMSHNPYTGNTFLSNGNPAPYTMWHYGHPINLDDQYLIGLVVKMNPKTDLQGLHTADRGWYRLGAFCEY
uniref:pulmonary surfactant-associated protein D-like n=1 Tax=Styela clava TaxID=7725 RepID=UPI001939CF0C|nr:pulmonary surfactant-associated protein D-like [Styela clava]